MEKEIRNDELGSEKIGKLLLRFSVPCVLSLLISSLYNLVDQVFVGNSRLGFLGNAATGVVFPLIVITQAFSWFFGDGSAAYLSICQGRKDTERASKALGTNLTLCVIVSLVMMVVALVFMEPILNAFGATENTLPLAKEYLFVLAFFFPAYMIVNEFECDIRADGSPLYSMICTGSGAVVNIILDPIFILVLDMGMKGAAIATVIGQMVSLVFCLAYFPKTKTFRITLSDLIPDFRNALESFKLGISTFITQIAIVAVSLTCNNVLKKYGAMSKYGTDIPLSIMAIQTKVFTIVINIVVGIVLGSQPIIGYNIGAGNLSRVKKTYRLILILTLAISVSFTGLFVFYPQGVLRIFGSTSDALYLEYGETFFRLFLCSISLCCFIKMSAIFFQAVGHPQKAIIGSLIRDIIIFVPMMILLSYLGEKNEAGSGVIVCLYSAIIADVIGSLISLLLTLNLFRRLEKEAKEKEEICK